MSDAANRLREAVVQQALHGPARASVEARRAAFHNDIDLHALPLIDKVSRNAWKVTASDIAAARTAGLSEDEIFELTVCAALGHSTRQLLAALHAVDDAAGGTR